jgi:hypothetical protein
MDILTIFVPSGDSKCHQDFDYIFALSISIIYGKGQNYARRAQGTPKRFFRESVT